MAFVSDTSSLMSLSDTIHFGSLEFSIAPRAGLWAPPVLAPFQSFRFGSLDFVTDHLGTLCLREEDTPLTLLKGNTSSIDLLADLDTEALARRIELMLGANLLASNVDLLLFSLRNIFRQLFGGTPLVLAMLAAWTVPVLPHKCHKRVHQGAPEDHVTVPAHHRVCGHDGVQSCLVR
jgi:hypothetical protein